MSSKLPWLALHWWREKDHALKAWLANVGKDRRTWTDEDTDHLVAGLGHAIGWPCLATPTITAWLYPWLPQESGVLFYLWGATSLGAALLSYLKQAETARQHSDSPPGHEEADRRLAAGHARRRHGG